MFAARAKVTALPAVHVCAAVCAATIGGAMAALPMLSAVMTSPSASRVERLTSKVVSQYWPASVPHGLRISSILVVVSKP